MLLYMESKWSRKKAKISRKFLESCAFFRSMQFPYRVTCQAKICFAGVVCVVLYEYDENENGRTPGVTFLW
jgi:hypothetical protein